MTLSSMRVGLALTLALAVGAPNLARASGNEGKNPETKPGDTKESDTKEGETKEGGTKPEAPDDEVLRLAEPGH